MKEDMFENLLDGVKEMHHHRAGMDTGARIHVPEHIDVAALRHQIGLTQKQFSITFGVPERTLKSWEAGTRTPEGMARVLLYMIGKDPKTVLTLATQT
jgi:putative transcriptional regulator